MEQANHNFLTLREPVVPSPIYNPFAGSISTTAGNDDLERGRAPSVASNDTLVAPGVSALATPLSTPAAPATPVQKYWKHTAAWRRRGQQEGKSWLIKMCDFMDAHPDLVVGVLMLGLFSMVFGAMFGLLWWSAHHLR